MAAAAASFAGAAPALAQPSWPSGPVRFIAIFPPGASTDQLSRIWCQRMTDITTIPERTRALIADLHADLAYYASEMEEVA